jgi:hypothetical protein
MTPITRIAIAISLWVLSVTAAAEPHVYKLNLYYGSILHNAEPMYYDFEHSHWTTSVALESGINWRRWYLDSRFHFESAGSKVMTAGLLYETGIRISDHVSLYWHHHSRHILDREPLAGSRTKYPLLDHVGVKLNFIGK